MEISNNISELRNQAKVVYEKAETIIKEYNHKLAIRLITSTGIKNIETFISPTTTSIKLVYVNAKGQLADHTLSLYHDREYDSKTSSYSVETVYSISYFATNLKLIEENEHVVNYINLLAAVSNSLMKPVNSIKELITEANLAASPYRAELREIHSKIEAIEAAERNSIILEKLSVVNQVLGTAINTGETVEIKEHTYYKKRFPYIYNGFRIIKATAKKYKVELRLEFNNQFNEVFVNFTHKDLTDIMMSKYQFN